MEYVTLNDGQQMPQLGLGLFQIFDLAEVTRVVKAAIAVGYRLFDTAAAYNNEAAVGRAIRESGVPRDEFFITSKLWIDQYPYEKAQQAIDAALKKLGTDYLDLMLLHQPYGDIVGGWRALEKAQAAGKVKSIGVSNFYPDLLKSLELMARVKPALDQIEVSPWYQRPQEVAFLQREGIAAETWAPLAEGKHDLFHNPTIAAIGARYGKSNPQVILRWLTQRGLIVIPKTVRPERMQENLASFDFQLTAAEMQQIARLDTGHSQFFDQRDPLVIESIFGAALRGMQI